MAKKSYNKMFLETLGTKPIAFNSLLAKLTRSATAGLFMSQLLYWWNKGWKENWIYKTIKEIEEETSLSRSEQDTAIRKWKELNILEVRLEGVPPIRHFRININKLFELLKNFQEQQINK